MPLTILTEPNPLLHQRCQKVKNFDDKLKKLAKEMTETLYTHNGIGLAAPQVGKLWRIVVMEYSPQRFRETENEKQKSEDGKPDVFSYKAKTLKTAEPIPLTILVNPKIVSRSTNKETAIEGCLSLPGVEREIRRAKTVKVFAQDIQGQRIKLRAKNLFARILQHEIDHLDGILITDLS